MNAFTRASLATVWVVLLSVATSADEPAKKAGRQEKPDKLDKAVALAQDVTQGALRIFQEDGTVVECPLKHTDVSADVSGFIARVQVTQTFQNPTDEKIEAVYVFPLPHEAAVDDMTMVIGKRKIVGLIKRRAEARRIYQQALSAGQTAALLEQERPNIFTQSVGNIEPGQEINIEISYVDVLKYDLGTYEFHFPMVVGPRYNPGAPIASPGARPAELQGKVSPAVPDTTRVPDASRISPPVLKPGHRTGHDVSLAVKLDAGVPVQELSVSTHDVKIERSGESQATVVLAKNDTLPNKDFKLRYHVVGNKPEMAVLAHTGKHSLDANRLGEGYFLLMIQPQEDERLVKSPPREVVFLVDVSGSMRGDPTKKVIEAMDSMLKLCRAQDTIQVITFAGQAQKLFDNPVAVNDANVKQALDFTQGLKGRGGTEMLKGVKLAIDEPIDEKRIRIIVMLTDGFIGNEAEIIKHVGKNCGDQIRFWAIGMGSSPNMFLIDGVAKQGGGMGKKLGLNEDTVALTQEVMTRIQRAQLAKINIDWGDHQVHETFPARIPELWAGRPVIVFGRYAGGGSDSQIKISGRVEGEPVSWPLRVELPQDQPGHDVLAKVWARKKIEDLMHQTYYEGSPAVEEEVTALALDYRLMSQYTSFVAVDAKEVDNISEPARPPRRMLVPVPLPAGTQWEGFFGESPMDAADGLFLGDLAARGKSVTMNRLSIPGPVGGALSGRSLQQSYGWGGVSRKKARLHAPTPGPTFARRGRRGQGQGQAATAGFEIAMKLSSPSVAHKPSPFGGFDRSIRSGSYLTGIGRVDKLAEKERSKLLGDRETARRVLSEHVGPLYKQAEQALKKGQELLESKKVAAARTEYVRAYFFAAAVANFTHSDGSLASQALDALDEIHSRQVEARKKQLPALDAKLALVLRDVSLREALDKVSQASGVNIAIVEGSVADAAALLGDDVRVSFLDLRRATVAQALDWILQPARLSWSADNGQVTVASERRREGARAWVYDVANIALPGEQELEKLKRTKKPHEAVGRLAKEFLDAAESHLKPGDDEYLGWFGPGALLVIGHAKTHAAAAAAIASLADPQAKVGAKLQELHAVTSTRAGERMEGAAKLAAANKKMRVAAIHDHYAWLLLADAVAGKLNLEALTELQIAWRRPETAELLKGPGAALALRSLWTISESGRALPDEAELVKLAVDARSLAQPAASQALKELEKDPNSAEAFFKVLYAALALRDDAPFVKQAAAQLTKKSAQPSPLDPFRVLAAALLRESRDVDGDALIELLATGAPGADRVVLTALACRRAGGQAWTTFRRERRDLVGGQPLPGSVVLLVNRLSGSNLSVVANW